MGEDRREREQVVGAVMVVGGGIAGIQASLDLAEAGYRVYLVENKSAIGGHMAQLDKTFPTNDCAMCIVSPKLVDTGRHRNIDLLVDSEVMAVRGQAGNFTVRVRTRPRYIDTTKCTGCGDCANVCPVIIPSHFNEGLMMQRAAHKLYPQAVPNAFAIEKRGISPCRNACPAGQRAQGYIALIREGRYEDALRVIKEDNPFPGICGRICNHRCEDACNRGKLDDPINIHALKRFVTDKVYSQERVPPQPAERKYAERVAVIGSGPCGLTAAQDLCKLGYEVTVFEALPVAGGMLRVGVPEYRLPSWIVDREVQDIVDLGVDLRLNTRIDNLDEVFEQGFNAVLIAVGAHEGRVLPIEGVDLPGVMVNTRFLRDVRLGNPPDIAGKRVLVLGGGNVAVDVARTAVRLGAAEVHMACLECREKMPAHEWEVCACEEEGIQLHPSRSFVRIVDNGEGRVGGVECVDVTFMEFSADGRLTLETAPGSEHIIPCDVVVFSIGQRAGLGFIPESAGVGITRQQTIAVNPNTFAASRPGVFAAGDATTGTAFVIEAVASGHAAAESIHRYLRGEELEPALKPELPVVELTRGEIQERIDRGEVHVKPRVPMPALPVEERVSSFAEVETGYTDELAQEEAARCLACGVCSECLSCWYTCQANAVDHDMVERVQDIQVGAVILAPGYEAFHAEQAAEYGWGRFPNVVTALQFERLLSASGPTLGHVERPSDHQRPKKIAFLQCVGSRDQTHDYCSAVCCMFATKEAIMAIEHERDTEITIFIMDMRASSKGYEEYYRRAREKYGIRYVRSRISAVREDPQTHNLVLRYVGDKESGIVEEEFDMVVLSVGMEMSSGVRELGRRLGIELDMHGFCRTQPFQPLQASKPGIFAVGPFREPKDIPESVVEGSGAAAAAGELLAAARHTMTRSLEYPPERDVSGEEPRTAVFICHCGSNIAGYLDVPEVTEYAKTLPCVVHAERNLYTCSQDTITHIAEVLKETGANRLVVASCTPLTHEPLFRSCLQAAGLNPNLFEMANIRNQCSWVHPRDREGATRKAKDLVRMAVARANRLEPLYSREVPVEKAALVIGGGVAGMNAALSLARQGFPVHLVEREGELGGNLRRLRYLAHGVAAGAVQFDDPQAYLRELIAQVEAEPLITVHLNTEVVGKAGFVGNFSSTLRNSTGTFEIRHGATILAVGGMEYKGSEYGYGSDPRVLTMLEFEGLLGSWEIGKLVVGKLVGGESGDEAGAPFTNLPTTNLPTTNLPTSVTVILCAGAPAERFCSRTCCTAALKNILKLKELNPQAQVTVLYRDMRAFGFRERLYQEARRQGVLFVRYDFDRKPQVKAADAGLQVTVWEESLGQELELNPDLVVLAMPMVPSKGTEELATMLKVGVDLDGWLMEAHVKLRPVDLASEGMFVAGAAHYPKFLDESIIQAQAAAGRAALILSQDTMTTSTQVAVVNQEQCVGCLTCVRACPYEVPRIKEDLAGVGGIVGAAYIEPLLCHGCGTCVAECPAKAITLMHYTDAQVMAKVDALFKPEEVCSV